MGNVSVQLVTVQWDKRVIKMLYLQSEQHCMNVENDTEIACQTGYKQGRK